MQKTLTRLFTAVLMAALLISASIMSVSAAETPICPDSDHTSHGEGWIKLDAANPNANYYGVDGSGNFTIYTSGKYYLVDDFSTANKQFQIGSKSEDGTVSNNGTKDNNVNVTLCLSGHNLTGTATLIRVGDYNTLNLVNCVADAEDETEAGVFTKGVITGKNYSLMLRGNATTNIGPNVHLDNRVESMFSIISMQVSGGKVNMYGGTISNNAKIANSDTTKTTGYEGIVNIVAGTTFNMYGGAISGNITKGNGTVHVRGTFNMYDGAISGNSATGNGDGVYSMKTFNMYNGVISNNNQLSDGVPTGNNHGVYVNGGTFNMNGGTISGHTAGSGAGVHLNNGNFTMNKGTISGNTATSFGGGVYVTDPQLRMLGQKFTMNGGTISNNTAPYGAAIQMNGSGTATNAEGGTGWGTEFIMNGGTITGNTTNGTSNGGAVCLFGASKFTMNDGSIKDNTRVEGKVHPGVHVGAKATMIVNGGEIGNNAGYGIANKGSVLTITGGSVYKFVAATSTTITGGKFVSSNNSQTTLEKYMDTATYEVKTIDESPYDLQVVKKTLGDCSTNPGDHSGWTTIGSEDEPSAFINEEGYYVLGANLTSNSQAAVDGGAASASTTGALVIDAGKGKNVTVCLNGHSINATDANKAIRIKTGNLILCNCVAATDENPNSGKVTYSGSNHVIQVGTNGGTASTASLTMGKNIHVDNSTTTTTNGIIHVGNDGIFTMNGGTIKGNTTADKIVWVQSGQFTMNDGEISDNKITKEGSGSGTVYLSSNGDKYAPEFILNNGIIKGNIAAFRGGGVYLHSATDSQKTGIFTMNGGTITDNKAANAGSEIYSLAGTVNMTAGSVSGDSVTIASKATAVFSDAAQVDVGIMNAYGNVTLSADDVTVDIVAVGGSTVAETSATSISAGTYGKVYNGNDAVPLKISGGEFGLDSDRNHLGAALANAYADNATETRMLSIQKNADGDAYVVAEGFANVGQFMDYKSSLAFSLYLNADVNFDSTGSEGFKVTAVSANKSYDANLTLDTITDNLKLVASGIAAKEMHDAITFTVKDGETVLFTETMSVYDAAQEWAADEGKAAMVAADMINYGVAAQKAFGYAEGKGMESTTEVGTWNTDDAYVEGIDATMIAVSLNLRERIELNVYVNSADVEIAKSEAYTVSTTDNGVTRITFDKINVKDVKDQIELTFTVDDEPVTVKYSVEAYVAAALEMDSQTALMIALQKYVDSVSAYFAQ